MGIKENLEQINSKIDNKATLVAVVKYASLEQIKEIIDLGVKNLGFNKYQQFLEISQKIDLKNISSHFIGNIQSNKIKKILELNPFLIQSVNSLGLAIEINKICQEKNKTPNVLLQIKTDSEKNSGFSFEEFEKYYGEIRNLKNINFKGLMTIPPEKEKIGEENLRKIFRQMKELKEKYNFEILSMGMSEDFEMAIQEGANMIRIGRKLFS
ncbi:YggS family pyridoxal phosphate-dependent enzyme [Candidatus Pacearchaeota archaeon]|nr:YggS family pyridoxal phosphate-dependent enzyme [Candidatus Pacearchaeota archaeon]